MSVEHNTRALESDIVTDLRAEMSYSSYLQIDTLLSAQVPQAYEASMRGTGGPGGQLPARALPAHAHRAPHHRDQDGYRRLQGRRVPADCRSRRSGECAAERAGLRAARRHGRKVSVPGLTV